MKKIEMRLIENEHIPLLSEMISKNEDLNLILEKITDQIFIILSEYPYFINTVKNRISTYLVYHTLPIISLTKKENHTKNINFFVNSGILNILIALLWRFSDNIKDKQDPTLNSHRNFIFLLRVIKNFLHKVDIDKFEVILKAVEKSYLYNEKSKQKIEDLANRYELFLIVPTQVFKISKHSLQSLKAYYNILTLSHDYLDLTKDIVQGNLTIPILMITEEYGEPIINTKNLIKVSEEIKSIINVEYLKIDNIQTELKFLAEQVISNT
jgi:hypothetical protein